MEEKDRLQDIPQFRTLEENLELRVALQQVDKLKAENLALKTELDEWKYSLTQIDEDNEDVEDLVMPEDVQKEIDEQLVLAEEDDLFKDWTPPSYEDVVDPEFDRGFKMGQDWLIQDIIEYLKNIKDNREA